jgi:hypothetical protein
MPYNIPTVTTNDISFGPAVLYLGAAGDTPTVDVGAIAEDGVSIEITNEIKQIMQGNPRVNVYSFSQQSNVALSFTSIEWDFNNLLYSLGGGSTSSSSSESFYNFGGNPAVTEVAILVQHYMAVSGNTMHVRLWKAQSAGGTTIPFGQDEHSFEYNFTAVRSTTDWGGSTLTADQELVQLFREG